jgi:hypothetical protein
VAVVKTAKSLRMFIFLLSETYLGSRRSFEKNRDNCLEMWLGRFSHCEGRIIFWFPCLSS